MTEFLSLLFQKSLENLPLLALILINFIVEFSTLYFVFRIKGVSQGIKLFLAIFIGNIILVPLLSFFSFIWLVYIASYGAHRPLYFIMMMLFYFVSIGIITLIKSVIISLTLKKGFNQFIWWLFIINSVSFAIGIIDIRSLFFVITKNLNSAVKAIMYTGYIAAMIKLSIMTVGLRKIISMRTILVIFLMTFVSQFFRSFLLRGMGLPLPNIVYPLVVYPLSEGVVGWIFLKGQLSFSKFWKLIPLLVVTNVVVAISARISFYALRVFFQI